MIVSVSKSYFYWLLLFGIISCCEVVKSQGVLRLNPDPAHQDPPQPNPAQQDPPQPIPAQRDPPQRNPRQDPPQPSPPSNPPPSNPPPSNPPPSNPPPSNPPPPTRPPTNILPPYTPQPDSTPPNPPQPNPNPSNPPQPNPNPPNPPQPNPKPPNPPQPNPNPPNHPPPNPQQDEKQAGQDEYFGPLVILVEKQTTKIKCFGIVLTAYHVITTCQCVANITDDGVKPNDPKDYKIFVGSVVLKETLERGIARMIPHDQCQLGEPNPLAPGKHLIMNDLGIIETYIDIPLKKPIKAVNLGADNLKLEKLVNGFVRASAKCKMIEYKNNINVALSKTVEFKLMNWRACQERVCKEALLQWERMPNLINLGAICGAATLPQCPGGARGHPILCESTYVGLVSEEICQSLSSEKVLLVTRFDESLDFISETLSAASKLSHFCILQFALFYYTFKQ